MSHEASSMAEHLAASVAAGDVQAQYHWAHLLVLDALANGAQGPEFQSLGASSNGRTGQEILGNAGSTPVASTKITQPHENGGRSEPVRITDADRRMSPSEQRNDVKSGPSSTHGQQSAYEFKQAEAIPRGEFDRLMKELDRRRALGIKDKDGTTPWPSEEMEVDRR